MRVGAYLEIVFVVIIVVAVLLAIGYGIVWKTTKNNAGVRKTEFARMRNQRDEAVEALSRIEDIVMQHVETMLDTPLNSDIRQVLREHNKKRLAAEKEGT